MKNLFLEPEVEVIALQAEDVIATSGDDDPTGEGQEGILG